jgi:hypothetical protein
MHIKFWSENMKKRDRLEDLGVGTMTILKRTLNRATVCALDSYGSVQVPLEGCSEIFMNYCVRQRTANFLTS